MTPCKRTRWDLRRGPFKQFQNGHRESPLFQSTWQFLPLSPPTRPLLCLYVFRFGKGTRWHTGHLLEQTYSGSLAFLLKEAILEQFRRDPAPPHRHPARPCPAPGSAC